MSCNPVTADLRTKFIATIGPTCDNRETIKGLMQAGACIFRSNFAHAQYDEYRQRVDWIRELNIELGMNVQIQADIQGTNIRVGEIPDGQIAVTEGGTYTFVTNGAEPTEDELIINDDHLHTEVRVGEPITFMDGALEGEIVGLDGHRITVDFINGGILKSRKSVNVPNTNLTRSSITEKDKKDLAFLINEGHVDWLAASFVGTRHDVEEIRALIGDKPIRIMSKIERRIAIDNIAEIIDASDAIMVARGDLGIELPLEEVPIIAKEIIQLAHLEHKPVVIATQMLMSMTHSLRPTRAEASDVVNAVLDRADAVMLSEETADGKHPVHAMETMVKIVRRAEQYKYGRPNYFEQFAL
jgi:pyruvate kinase